MRIGFLQSVAAFLIGLVLVGCSPEEEEGSGPDSLAAHSEDSLETYRSVMDGDEPAAALTRRFEVVEQIHYRAEALQEAFDRRLDSLLEQKERGALRKGAEDDPLQSETYRSLMAHRDVRDQTLSEITFLYRRLVLDARAPALRGRDAVAPPERAQAVLDSVNAYLKSRRGEEILAHLPVYDRLRGVVRSVNRTATRSPGADSVETPLPPDAERLLDDPEAAARFEQQNARALRREVERAGRSDAPLDSIIGEAVEASRRTLAPAWTRDGDRSGTRSAEGGPALDPGPSAASLGPARPVCASAGAPGEVNGSGFRGEGVWAFTYDDGPHETWSEEIAEAFRARGHRATFFWLAEHVEAHPTVVDSVEAMGMALANHSYTHANLSKDDADLDHEITASTAVEDSVYSDSVAFFRLPYGAGSEDESAARKRIAREGLIHVTWNVDGLDWQDRDPASIAERVRKQMRLRGSGIILLHDVQAPTAEATRRLLRTVATADTLRLVTIPEVIRQGC